MVAQKARIWSEMHNCSKFPIFSLPASVSKTRQIFRKYTGWSHYDRTMEVIERTSSKLVPMVPAFYAFCCTNVGSIRFQKRMPKDPQTIQIGLRWYDVPLTYSNPRGPNCHPLHAKTDPKVPEIKKNPSQASNPNSDLFALSIVEWFLSYRSVSLNEPKITSMCPGKVPLLFV